MAGMATKATVSLSLKKVHDICLTALTRHGASAEQSIAIADMLTAAERMFTIARFLLKHVDSKVNIDCCTSKTTRTVVVVDSIAAWI